VHDWELPGGISALVGNNGVGKSTVANAIAWALYGPDVLPTGKADVVTWGAEKAEVALWFQTPSGAYQVTRWQRVNGTSGASLDRDGEGIANGLDPTTVEVGKVLGMDRVGFLVSVFSRQEELAGLSSLTPGNRVKTVLRLLGVDIVSSAIDRVRDETRLAKRELEILRRSSTDVRLAQKRLRELDDEILSSTGQRDALARERASVTDELKAAEDVVAAQRAEMRAFDQYKQADDALIVRINRASKAVQDALAALGTLRLPPNPGPQPEMVDREQIIDLLTEQRMTTERTLELQKAHKDGVCPHCGRPFDEMEEHMLEIEKELAALDSKNVKLNSRLEELRELEKAAEEWQEKADLVDRYLNLRLQTRRVIWGAQDEYRNASVERNLLKVAEEPDISTANEIVETHRERLAEIRERTAYLSAKMKADEHERKRVETDLASGNQVAADVQEAEKAVTTLDVTVSELIVLKAKLVEEAIPSLEAIASELVSELTDGQYDELALTPNYEIQYRSPSGELKGFAHLSGGEQDVFALALRLAIAELQSDSVGVLFLDEVLESLDDDRQEMAWTAFEKLTKRYQQILVVTHVEKFRDRAPSQISL